MPEQGFTSTGSSYKDIVMTLANKSSRMWPDENWVGLNVVITDDERPDLGAGEQKVINQVVKRQYVKGQDMTNEVRDEIGR